MKNKDNNLYGAIEAGGTKFICAIGTGPNDIRNRIKIPTRSAEETLDAVAKYFANIVADHGRLDAIGVGCFGPVDIDRSSKTFGTILSTPKPGWSGVDIVREIMTRTDAPVVIDTDVNCALMGEAAYGAGRGLRDIVYVTVGTGIGGGIMSGGRILYGTSHPEIGHMLMPKQPDDASFAGVCPYHKDACIEGLASGPAIRRRWGAYSYDLPIDHEAWDLQARYVAALCHNIMFMLAPERIILGGGVMAQRHLFSIIRQRLHQYVQGYGAIAHSCVDLEKVIVPPKLDGDAGILGAFQIAAAAPTDISAGGPVRASHTQ